MSNVITVIFILVFFACVMNVASPNQSINEKAGWIVATLAWFLILINRIG